MGNVTYSCESKDGGRWGDPSDSKNGQFGMMVQAIHKTKRDENGKKLQTGLTLQCPDDHEHEFPACVVAALNRPDPGAFKANVPDLDGNGVQKSIQRGTGRFERVGENDVEITETVLLEVPTYYTKKEQAEQSMAAMAADRDAKEAAPVVARKPLPKKTIQREGKAVQVDDAVVEV